MDHADFEGLVVVAAEHVLHRGYVDLRVLLWDLLSSRTCKTTHSNEQEVTGRHANRRHVAARGHLHWHLNQGIANSFRALRAHGSGRILSRSTRRLGHQLIADVTAEVHGPVQSTAMSPTSQRQLLVGHGTPQLCHVGSPAQQEGKQHLSPSSVGHGSARAAGAHPCMVLLAAAQRGAAQRGPCAASTASAPSSDPRTEAYCQLVFSLPLQVWLYKR